MARDCNCLTVQWVPVQAGLWLSPRGHFYVTVNTTKIIHKCPNHLPCVFLLPFSEREVQSYWRHLVPLGWVSQDPHRALGKVLVAAFQHRRIQQVLEPLFSGLAFFGFFWCKVRTAPLGQGKVSRGAAAWPQHLAGDVVHRAETPSLPSELNSSRPIHVTVCLPSWKPREHQQICWHQNLMATFFPSAKFSIGAMCLGHTCQAGLAPAASTGHCWPSLALAGLLSS